MREVESLPSNGLSVVSTFSGGGGSSTGYRMAGYRVLWANEFVPAARETYRANHPSTTLDERDIRDVEAFDVLRATGLGVGQLDLLDGSPPCSAFSTSGRGADDWHKVKAYSGRTQTNIEDLFFEYVRLVDGLKPRAFIAENVSGLVKGASKGKFKQILRALGDCGYRVEARLLDAAWLGVPQTRKRVIFVGVRGDLKREPVFPEPLPYQYTLSEALVGLERDAGPSFRNHAIYDAWLRCDPVTGNSDQYMNLIRLRWNRPSNTMCATFTGGTATIVLPDVPHQPSVAQLKRICSFPDDYVLTGPYPKQWERLGRSVPPLMMRAIASAVRDRVLG